MHGTNSQTNKGLGSPSIGCIKSFYTNFFSEEKIVLVSESFDVDFILDQGNVWTKNMTKGHNLNARSTGTVFNNKWWYGSAIVCNNKWW